MRRLPQNLSMLAVSVLMVSSLAVAPVFAEHGSSSDSTESSAETAVSTSDTTTAVKADDNTSVKSDVEIENETHVSATQVKNESGSLRAEAAKLLATERQNEKAQKTAEQRLKACQAHQTEVTTREQNYARNAQKHLDVFNGIYVKVLAFQTSKNLTSADLTSLKSAADTQKAAAATAVAALSSTDLKLDCSSPDPAATVATLKTTVKTARTALQDYRTAIKNLIVGLEKAVGSTSSSTSSDSNTTTNATTTTGGNR